MALSHSLQSSLRVVKNGSAIARLLPNCQRTIVGRFRSRSDADGHLQCLRQLMPHASFVVVFDCQPDLDAVTASAERTEEVVV